MNQPIEQTVSVVFEAGRFDIPAVVLGDLAVHPRQKIRLGSPVVTDGYVITHVPSGRSISAVVSTTEHAAILLAYALSGTGIDFASEAFPTKVSDEEKLVFAWLAGAVVASREPFSFRSFAKSDAAPATSI